MGGVDHHDVDARIDQRLGALEARLAHPGRGGNAQPAQLVLAGGGVEHGLLGVLERQQAGELALRIGDQQLLDPARPHQADRLLAVGGLAQDGKVLGGHHHPHRRVRLLREAHVAVGDDADNAVLLVDHREAGEAVTFGQRLRVGQRLVGGEGDRVVDDAALEAFHPAHFLGLTFDVEVLVDHPDAAGLRHGDRHARLGDRVHGRRQQRDVERNALGDPGARVGRGRQNAGSCGKQQNIVEGEGLANLHGGGSLGGYRLARPYCTDDRRGKGPSDLRREGCGPGSAEAQAPPTARKLLRRLFAQKTEARGARRERLRPGR